MDKNSYALGMSVAHNMISSGVKNVDFKDFAAGVEAILSGKNPEISFEEASSLLDKYFAEIEAEQKKQMEQKFAANKEEGEKFLAENRKKEGVITLPSGLQYKVIKEGDGELPKSTDSVRCHYKGTLIDGTKFDSSYDRNEPAVFGVTQVIPGWVEALQLMSVGSKWELYIPYNLAYGERGVSTIPPYSTLVFTVELLEIC